MKLRLQRWVMIHIGEKPSLWWLNDLAHAVLCLVFGHTPERDQCNNPEHDYCLWCGKSMPNQWKKP